MMTDSRIKIGPLSLLYFGTLLFIVMSFTNNPVTALNIYVINLLFLSVVVGYLFFLDGPHLKLNFSISFAVIVCTIFLLTMPVYQTHVYTLIIFLKIVVLILFFRRVSIPQKEMLNFINFSFACYLLLSILFWIFSSDDASNGRLQNEEFTVHIFGFSYQVLHGIKGSPAHVDTYSAVVLIINLTINSMQKYRKIVIFLALLGILLSFRLTPFVGLFLVFISKPWLNKRYFFGLFNLLGMLLFILLISLLTVQPQLMLAGKISLSDFAYLGTHARSQIWVMQTDIMLTTYDIYQYIFGGFQVDKFSVPLMQFWGAETGRFASNPHNNYLLLFFRSPLLFIYMMLVFYWCSLKYLNKRYYLLFSFILLACYTNSSLISLENPVYIYLFIYLLLEVNGRKENIYVRSER